MGEIWAAAVAIGGAAISAYGDQKAKEKAAKDSRAMTKEDRDHDIKMTGYNRALEDYYTQKDRVNKQRGLDQFRQFSTLQQYAPEYVEGGNRMADPVMPKYADQEGLPQEIKSSGGGKKKESTFNKINKILHPGRKLLGF